MKRIITSCLLTAVIISCADNQTVEVEPVQSSASLNLKVSKNLSLKESDSIALSLDWSNGASSNHRFQVNSEERFVLSNLEADSNLHVEAIVEDSNSRLLYFKDSVIQLQGGKEFKLDLELLPQFAILDAEMHIGVDNPLGIVGGSIILKNEDNFESSPLEIFPDGSAEFKIERVFFGTDYELILELLNLEGETVYADTTILDITSNEFIDIEIYLKSIFADLNITFQFKEPGKYGVRYELPLKSLRKPSSSREITFSEILSNPKSNGDDYEYIELYNSSSDSIDLEGCFLKRTRGSTTPSSREELKPHQPIAPGSFFVIGKDSVNFSDLKIESFTLTNSGQSLLLECDGLVIDTLNYAANQGEFPLEIGVSMQLNWKHYREPLSENSWCLATDRVAFESGFSVLGSPGLANQCVVAL